MITRIPCNKCGSEILPTTAEATGGICMACKQGIRRGAVDRHGRSIEKQELRTEKANLQVIEDRLASLQRKAAQLCDLQVDDHLENCPFASARNSKERAELVIDLYDGIDGLEESVGHNVDPMVLLIQLSGIRSRMPSEMQSELNWRGYVDMYDDEVRQLGACDRRSTELCEIMRRFMRCEISPLMTSYWREFEQHGKEAEGNARALEEPSKKENIVVFTGCAVFTVFILYLLLR